MRARIKNAFVRKRSERKPERLTVLISLGRALRGEPKAITEREFISGWKGGKDLYPGLKFDLGEEQSGGKEMNVNRALLSDAVLAKSPFFPFCHLFFFVFF